MGEVKKALFDLKVQGSDLLGYDGAKNGGHICVSRQRIFKEFDIHRTMHCDIF
jgi:hypothetical protein